MKKQRTYGSEDSSETRARIKQHYINKYFSLFSGNYKWTNLDDQQRDFIMRRLWSDGVVALSLLKVNGVTINNIDNPNGVLLLTKFVTSEWNIYDFPTKVTLLSTRGYNLIPTSVQEVNKDVVIMYAQRNHKSVLSCIECKIDELVDVEMTIHTNLKLSKIPFVIGVNPENKDKMKSIWDSLMNDEVALYMSVEDANNFTALQTGAPYIIDKLTTKKKEIEDEILTILGVDNLGIQNKKEQLRVDEINANNQMINNSADVYVDSMLEGCNLSEEVLGYPISVEKASQPVTATAESNNDEGDSDYED